MLVLTRKEGERILIGEEIEVMVLGVRGDRVRLGIIAPHDLPVHREEVRQRIMQEAAMGKAAELGLELEIIS